MGEREKEGKDPLCLLGNFAWVPWNSVALKVSSDYRGLEPENFISISTA